MAYYEEIWLKECPKKFKPIFYKTYVDDYFVIFKNRDEAKKFHSYLNSKHENIKFSIAHENERSLPFLDILMEREECNFVYRISPFTGLGISFFSFSPKCFKTSTAIVTLIY